MYSLLFDSYFHNKSLVLICLLPLLAWITIWLFLFVLSWLLKNKYGLILRINGIRFFQLNGLTLLLPDGCKIEIEFIWLSLHLINSNDKSLFGIYISGCRIENGNFESISALRSRGNSESSESTAATTIVNSNQDGTPKQLNWSHFLKFISINVTDIHLNQIVIPNQSSLITNNGNNQQTENCLLTLSVQDLKLFKSSNYDLKLKLNGLILISEGLKLKIKSFYLKINSDRTIVALKNSEIYSLTPLVDSNAINSTDINQRQLYSSCFTFSIDYINQERSFTFSDDSYLLWSVSFHMNMVQAYHSIRYIWKTIKSPNTTTTTTQQRPTSSKKNLITMTTIKLGDKVRVGALLSNSGQTVFLEFPCMIFSISDRITFMADCSIALVVDNNVIGRFDQLRFTRLPETESVTIINRKDFTDFGKPLNLSRNNVCSITIETIKLVFPYKFNFAEIFNEKFIGIMKWLRKYHSTDKPVRDDVKCDLHIKVNTITVEVGDDPFEVKLRDNYELMEDEYHESKKRIQMWREKIDESKKSKSLTESKLNELFAALSKKQENVYIERHRKLYLTSPPRAHLFLISVEYLQLKIAADSSLTGYDNLVDIITKRLDKESPFPTDIKFVTLWGRCVQGSIGSFCSRLRDFPKPLLDLKNLKVSGLLLGAEKEAGFRSRRECFIDLGPGLAPLIIKRSMSPLKFYHDLTFDVDTIAYTHGACWEPVLQQLNICFESIIKPSVDPSPTLPWWDRLRLLFHGSLRVTSRNLSFFLHGSLNPYNSTELIEIALGSPKIDCVTGKIDVKGTLGLLVHTASKYDERKILNFPDVRISVDLMWECLGNPYDHHPVTPHAADKVPDYSIHQNWDSYRAFRSQNLKVQICIENLRLSQKQIPSITFFSSTLKWFENQKAIFRGIARLTRRGKLFGNVKPRKKPFSRIFKEIRLTVYLKKFKVYYWSSLSKQLGLEILSGSLSHSAIHKISFVPHGDGLCRRPRPVSYVACMNSEVSDVEIWLCKNDSVKMTPSLEDIEDQNKSRGTVRHFFVSFQTMSYNRASSEATNPSEFIDIDSNDPTHGLVIHGLKGAWTKQNRDIAVSLFDLYMNAEQLKRNLSTDALKGIRIEGQSGYCGGSPVKGKYLNQPQSSSPASTLNKNYAASMLQKLIADSESNPEGVYTDDVEGALISEEPKLRGIAACSDENMIKKNWLIELVNSQVMLRGCETFGYMIVSASKTQIVQKLYTPVWKDRTLLSKTSLVGSIEGMQYYATVDAHRSDDDEIDWLTVDNIEEKTCTDINEPPDLVGSGRSAGGVVSPVVGRSDILSSSPIQLQRIISRCSCQFYYVNYSKDVPSDIVDKAPPLPEEDDLLNLEPWDEDIAVDSFTMNHHDLEIYTNSQQFAMIMDLVNNLLLYVEPHRREAFENLQRMKFKSVLDPTESLRGPILVYQDNLRAMIARLKQVEKESYYLQKALLDEKNASGVENGTMTDELAVYERQIMNLKEKINRTNEELTLMINLFKESQLTADKTRENSSASQEGETSQALVSVVRRIEICFKQATWKLTETDGQMGLAKVELNNFIYTKVVKSDDSFEHSLELGYIKVSNLIPNQKHPIVLEPAPSKPNIPVDSRRALRVYCRESPPQNGIPIKEHFEVNVIPLNLVVTYKFYKCLENFFFNQEDTNRTTIDATAYPMTTVGGVGAAAIGQGLGAGAVVMPGGMGVGILTSGGVKGGGTGSDNVSLSSAAGVLGISSGGLAVSGVGGVTSGTGNGKRKTSKAKSTSNSSNSLPSASSTVSKSFVPDDVEKMRQRAQRNKTFAYIKITEVPLRVSYKDKNIGNIQDFKFILPTIEYHNQTWEWLDLINAIKRESKHRLLSQALKQKLWITPTFSSITNHTTDETKSEDSKPPKEEEERKAKLLLGEIAVPSTKTSDRVFKGLSIFTHRNKDNQKK